MEQYSAFGLDNEKKSQDAGVKQRIFFDPFSKVNVSKGKYFYLCFENWVIAPATLPKLSWPAEIIAVEPCFKCNQKKSLRYYEGDAAQNGLCEDCIGDAERYYGRSDIFTELNF